MTCISVCVMVNYNTTSDARTSRPSVDHCPKRASMRVATGPGPIIGVLILAQMIGGALVNFVLAAPLFGSPGFLVNAAPHSLQIALSVLLGIATGALALAMAVIAFP